MGGGGGAECDRHNTLIEKKRKREGERERERVG